MCLCRIQHRNTVLQSDRGNEVEPGKRRLADSSFDVSEQWSVSIRNTTCIFFVRSTETLINGHDRDARLDVDYYIDDDILNKQKLTNIIR